jgi:hypothetical protein
MVGQQIGKIEETGNWHHVRCLIGSPDPGDEFGPWRD